METNLIFVEENGQWRKQYLVFGGKWNLLVVPKY